MMKMKSDPPDVAADLQALVTEICKEGSHLLPSFSDSVNSAMENTTELSTGFCADSKTTSSALENAAVMLWNKTVVMKTKGSISNVIIAKLRHIAFRMVTFSCSSTKEETSLRKQILMGMKAARAWIESKNLDHAEKVMEVVQQLAQTLHILVVERCSQSGNSEDLLAVEDDKLKMLCFKVEIYCGQGRCDEALKCFQMAKEYLSKFPKESGYLSMLSYNMGVLTFHEKRHELSVVWLRESYDLGKDSPCMTPMLQARTLRLLASSYLEMNDEGCIEKAVNTISLANTEHTHPAGVFLQLRIMLKNHDSLSAIKSVVDKMMMDEKTGVDMCLCIMLLLKQHSGAYEVCPIASSSLNRFRGSPDYGRLMTAYLDLLLHVNLSSAKNFAKECIIAHNTDGSLDVNTKKQFHILFWEQATHHFESKEFSEALDWFNFSLSLFRCVGGSIIEEENMPKLHRNRANCYLGLQQLSQAHEALIEAKEADPTSVYTHYLLFKLALMKSDEETAKNSLQAMVTNYHSQNLDHNSLMCLAAQLAMSQKCESLATVALYSIVEHNTDSFQVIKALRCLIKLHFTPMVATPDKMIDRNVVSELISLIRMANNKLELSKTEGIDFGKIQTEAAWFMKISWNLTLKCVDDPAHMKEFCMLCYHLVPLCGEDTKAMSHKKICLLMATAACIQMARATSEIPEKKAVLEESLHYISEYKTFDSRLMDCNIPEPETRRSTQILMLLYEFEALTKLNDLRAESVLERALVLHNPEPKLFETIAGLAVDFPARQPRLSMRALKVAVHTHLQCEEPDFVKCSKDIHQLIELSLTGYEEESFTYFKETADILDKKAQGRYPQMEVVWLMTKAWNTGIRHFCCSSYAEAERWCAMSMRLLPHIGSLRESYEDQMMAVYTDILEGAERQRSTQQHLEE